MEGIPLIRAVLRRMSLLARLRAQVERGNSPDAVMASQGKSLFWKEKDSDRPAARALALGRAGPRASADCWRRRRQVKASGGARPSGRRRGAVRHLPPGGAAALGRLGNPSVYRQIFSPLSRWQIMSSWSSVE